MLKTSSALLFILLWAGYQPASHKSSAPIATYDYQPAKSNPSFLFLSDIHLNATTDTTAYGSDTGMELWKLFLAKADSILSGPNAPKFIVYTGDLPAHYSWSGSAYIPVGQRATHNGNLTAILTGLRKLANKHNKPLFYLPGNNDGLAGDYYSFTDSAGQTAFSLVPDKKNPYPALNINRISKKAPCIVSNPHPTMGYYSARPIPGLRLIALNTVMYNHDFAVNDGSNMANDRNQQLKWLAAQLAAAKANGEKVWLAMHVPPGTDAYSGNAMWTVDSMGKNKWLNQFLALTTRYQATIAGILYGHTHMDEVRRLYDSTGTNITEVAISCPGVTPQHYNNPGFKTVNYDAANKELMDFTTHYTLPSSTGYWGTASYSFNSAYQNTPNTSIYQRLKSLTLTEVYNYMNPVYNTMNGPGGANIERGIEVNWGQ
jgi:sphingomyelin phosphodiesterase acid-like 3